MTDSTLLGMVLAGLVFFGLVRVFGPRGWRKPKRRTKRTKRVRVHPLILKERKLAAELRAVRAKLREQHLL
ncbi:hypothetical protein GCM10010885_15020 [Alicyclobacillus cellulosilyticus]|uniref:Uncharacterized protein n=1 Tax=Alicyclobacillus cellulosilyticus TaxID=1003997 RepID=A0A917KDV1_9BACL|nr:hypothetical protein [Alicyclobacillus cellulosilyticus]GGJ06898.1 hypothetical protein GCM10010885_15020 [Alicyclobacillus cellulosilyticus]